MTVDLRSDTLTFPGPDMRRVMAEAAVGDDVFGEDPTVNRLEELAAERTGKEAAAFVVSGTMANLLAILSIAGSGEEVIVDADAHVFIYEGAGASAVGGIQLRPLTTPRGVMTVSQVLEAIRPDDDIHQPRTAAIALEDTHNRHGGVAWPLGDLAEVAAAARRHGLAVHMDGARVFNAAVAQGVDVRAITEHVDTIAFCLSKGLGAPVGSILAGPAPVLERARRWRKLLGGGWRDAGQLAAAGLMALEGNVERLADDHRQARTLAEGLAELPGVRIDLSRVETNLVIFEPVAISGDELRRRLAARGVLATGMGGDRVRFTTYMGIDAAAVQAALAATADALDQA